MFDKELIKRIFVLVLIFGIGFGSGFLISCGTFQPYINKNQPDSCNDSITIMRLISETNGVFDKSGTTAFLTLLSLSYSDCKADREKLIEEIKAKTKSKRFNACKKMIYGEALEPKESNYKKYTDFQECLNQK